MALITHGINIVGTNTTLYVAESCSQRMLLSQQIGHQRLHSSHVKEYARGTVRYEGNRSYIYMSPIDIKLFPGLSQFI